jgi:CRISPR system Cascade subunit CasD
MKSTLLIQLAAPLQAWGESARFNLRPTQSTPTKSGVLGMVCAAMGIPRSDEKTLLKLNDLKFGVRIDRPGRLLIDFQTVSQVVNAKGDIPRETKTTLTDRHYLADAIFLAGLESAERSLLEEIHYALLKPRWLLCLGRKSCMPSDLPWLKDGLQDTDLETALRQYPPLRANIDLATTSIELEDEIGKPRMDTPIHFGSRKYAPRFVRKVSMQEEEI